MGLQQFEILFDNPAKSYFPGQIVTGRVIVVVDQEKKIQGLKIKFDGKASVHWTETERPARRTGIGVMEPHSQNQPVTRTYADSDNFFNYKYYAAGLEGSDTTLPAGRSEYPFQFTLPPVLPSSYKGAHGSVTYEVQAVMKRPWKFNHEVKQEFTVNALVDLNADPAAGQPALLTKSKTLCCFCCKSGPVSLVVKLPKKGYVAGEYIGLIAEINNMSNKDISAVTLKLVQTAKFFAQGKTKHSSTVLGKVDRDGIKSGNSDMWQGNLLQVPSVPPNKLGNCRIIHVDYTLIVKVVIPCPSKNLRVSVPIVIGTIPLRTAFANLMPQNPHPMIHSPYVPSAPIYPDSPPPYYHQSVDFGYPNPQPTAVGNNPSNLVSQKPEYTPNNVTYGWNLPS